MVLIAQVTETAKEVARELRSLHETWGPSNTIMIVICGILLVGIVSVVLWIKPRADKVVDSHLKLVSTMTAKLEGWPSDMAKICQASAHSMTPENVLLESGWSQRDVDLVMAKRRERQAAHKPS